MLKSDYITVIEKAILDGNIQDIENILKERNTPARKDILDALNGGIQAARARLTGGELSIPEFLLCIDAFKAGASLLKANRKPNRGIPVYIGVVEGDVHDLGKNIVASVLDACGYAVVDMGKDVTREKVRSYISGRKKAVIALSSMMSTSLSSMKDIIAWLAETSPGVKTLVGGACLDAKLARSIGASGYAENASTAPAELQKILGTIQ